MGDRNKRIDVKDSILLSISEIVGVHKDYDDFDDQLIIHTNTVLQLLVQKGIGKEGVFVQNDQLTWNDFLKDHQVNVRCVISWAGLKVKSLFDPPSNPTLANALNESLKELEWMFYITENYIGEIGSSESNTSYVGEVENIQPYLFNIEYDELDYDFAYKWMKNNHETMKVDAGGCSSFKNGKIYGRSFDFNYNEIASFVVKTKDTIGMSGHVPGLTNKFVKSGEDSDLYKIVPFMIVDGINKHGVVCNTNLVPKDKGTTTGSIPQIEKDVEICSLMLPRYILDHFSTALGAAYWIRDYASVYVPKFLQNMGYETHLMIGDEQDCFCVEFIDNHAVVIDMGTVPYMTNFFLKDVIFDAGKVYTPADVLDGHLPSVSNNITPHGSGLERFNLMADNLENVVDVYSGIELLKKLFYTNSYKASTTPFWYSEFVGGNLTVDSPPADFTNTVNEAKSAFLCRNRKSGLTWQSTHSTVYDIENKKMYLISQEFADSVYVYEV